MPQSLLFCGSPIAIKSERGQHFRIKIPRESCLLDNFPWHGKPATPFDSALFKREYTAPLVLLLLQTICRKYLFNVSMNFSRTTSCFASLQTIVTERDCAKIPRQSRNEPRYEKTGLRGFRPGLTQTRLYSYRRWLEARNFVFRN